jgi:hypothetical protein
VIAKAAARPPGAGLPVALLPERSSSQDLRDHDMNRGRNTDTRTAVSQRRFVSWHSGR